MPDGIDTILTSTGEKFDRAGHSKRLVQLLIRMSLYYLVFGAIFILTLTQLPGVAHLFPIGGIEEFSANVGEEVAEFNDILSGETSPQDPVTAGGGATSGWLMEAITLFLAMLSTFLLMLPVSWVYKRIHEGDEYDHSIDETTLILPAIFAGIITVVQHSLTLAFALAGIMAGVRFRRALNDTFDTLFIFVAIGVGLAAGASSIEIAIVITVFFNYTTVLVCIFGDGLESKYEARRESLKQMEKRAKRQKAKEKEREKAAEDEAKALESARNDA